MNIHNSTRQFRNISLNIRHTALSFFAFRSRYQRNIPPFVSHVDGISQSNPIIKTPEICWITIEPDMKYIVVSATIAAIDMVSPVFAAARKRAGTSLPGLRNSSVVRTMSVSTE
jgi:hypothetical protein